MRNASAARLCRRAILGRSEIKILTLIKHGCTTAARGAPGLFILKVASAGLLFVVHIVYARILGTQAYGEFVYAFTVASLLALLARAGYDQAAIRYVSAYRATEQWSDLAGFLRSSRQRVTRNAAWLAGLTAAAALLTNRVGWMDTDLAISLCAAMGLVPGLSRLQLADGVLRGLHRVVLSQGPQALLLPAILLIALPAYQLAWPDAQRSFVSALLIYTVAVVSVWLILERWSQEQLAAILPRGVAPRLQREWTRTAFSLLLVAGFNQVILQTDTLMLGALLDREIAGTYYAASKVAGLLVFVLVAVNGILSPRIARAHALGDQRKLRLLVNRAANWSALGGMAFAIFLVLFGETVLSLFGTDFTASYPVLLVLICGQLVYSICGPASTVLSMTGRHAITARILGVSALINILLNWVCIARFGAIGAAFATAVTMTLWNLAMSFAAWRLRGVLTIAWPSSVPRSSRH